VGRTTTLFLFKSPTFIYQVRSKRAEQTRDYCNARAVLVLDYEANFLDISNSTVHPGVVIERIARFLEVLEDTLFVRLKFASGFGSGSI
jgi:hypothetical protein